MLIAMHSKTPNMAALYPTLRALLVGKVRVGEGGNGWLLPVAPALALIMNEPVYTTSS